MVDPLRVYKGAPDQGSLIYIIFGRDDLSRDLVIDYWTNPHATLVARCGGKLQYRTHSLDHNETQCWPSPPDVETAFPDDWMPDGISESYVTSAEAFSPTPIMESLLHDEQHFLRRGLVYSTRPNGTHWHRDELTPVTADMKRPECRVIALVRRREGVNEEDFIGFIQSELAMAIVESDYIVELKTLVFAPYNESIWPSVGVSHIHPAAQTYDAAIILAGTNRASVDQLFRSHAFRATIPLQSTMFECLHSAEVQNSVFMVEDGVLQLPALRGVSIAEILHKTGATSQTEDPVLSQVLSVPVRKDLED